MSIKWNTIKYIDCLDPDEGLPSLPDKCIDLGFTDPPWGVNMKENTRKYIDGRIMDNSNKIHYNDNITENFNRQWFSELLRICKRIILIINDKSVLWFIRNFPENDPTIVPLLWKNGFSGSKIALGSRRSLYLYYGKFEKDKKQIYDYLAESYYTKKTICIPFTLYWGATNHEKHFNHPSPKGLEIPIHIFKQLKPESIIDPFSGSGTYCYAANILKIPYLGYEINNQEYKEDIEWRFEQNTIGDWL